MIHPSTPLLSLRGLRTLLAGGAAALLLAAAGGAHAQAHVNATIGGALAPGVYGRINIGNAPPPPLLYSQPVIVHQPAVVVPRAPIYLYVPPGHSKNWSRHCARYNACNQPVYFVQEPPRRADPHRGHGPRFDRHDRRWDNDHRHGGRHDRDRGHRGGKGDGHGTGHGHGKGNGHRNDHRH